MTRETGKGDTLATQGPPEVMRVIHAVEQELDVAQRAWWAVHPEGDPQRADGCIGIAGEAKYVKRVLPELETEEMFAVVVGDSDEIRACLARQINPEFIAKLSSGDPDRIDVAILHEGGAKLMVMVRDHTPAPSGARPS